MGSLVSRAVTSVVVLVCALLLVVVLRVLRVLARRRLWGAAEVLAAVRGGERPRPTRVRVEVVRAAPVNQRRARPAPPLLLLGAPHAAGEWIEATASAHGVEVCE